MAGLVLLVWGLVCRRSAHRTLAEDPTDQAARGQRMISIAAIPLGAIVLAIGCIGAILAMV